MQIFYLFEILLHSLVHQNLVYIKISIKVHSYRHFLLTISWQVVTKGHKTQTNLPIKAADLFKYE